MNQQYNIKDSIDNQQDQAYSKKFSFNDLKKISNIAINNGNIWNNMGKSISQLHTYQ